MSDTPETDALISVGLENADRECVPADFARKLEQERDEAREESNKLSGAYEDATNYYARIIELKEELDEAREALVKILKNE